MYISLPHIFGQTIIFALFLVFLQISESFAIESVTDRKQVATEKYRKFPKSPIARSSIAVAASYDSDQNSKEYQFNSKYFYQSNKQMHRLDFLYDLRYADTGSGANRQHLVKKSELYDAEISSKFLISKTKNYSAFYSRTSYDEKSKYYRDLRNAIGFGRIFFNDSLELDTSIGYHDVAAYGNEVFFVPSMRINLKFSEKITFIHRSYIFLDHEGHDSELKSNLRYRVSEKLSFELNHTFDQRRYEDDAANRQINLIARYLSVGFVYDLD